MWELYFTQSGDIYKEFVARTGIKAKRGEGSMTRSDAKLMRQFVTEYKGESINIEAHITYGKLGQSIHFGFSNNDKKLSLAHVVNIRIFIYPERENKECTQWQCPQ